MKKQVKIIESMLILVFILMILEIIMLVMAPDIKHIILSCIVVAGFVLNLIFYVVAKIEVKKILFEYEDEDMKIRLVEEDDYQLVRSLLDTTPLENSPEEYKKLSEFEVMTIDFTRLHYHYIVFSGDEIISLFYAKNEKELISIEFKNNFEKKESVKNKLIELTNKTKYKVEFKN